MEREIVSVVDRCRECRSATRVLVLHRWTDEEGQAVKALFGDAVPHSRADCRAMQALEKEEWPTLW